MSVIQSLAAVRSVTPLLYVENVEHSAAFYYERLGFEMTEKWAPDGKLAWCYLQRGGAAVMLQQACEEDGPSDQRGRGVMLFFVCDDADAIHAEFAARGLELAPPEVAFYGMNQLFLKDPDGYDLCFQNPTERT